MEATDSLAALTALAEELRRRGWKAHLTGPVLKVVNPAAPRLNDQISSDGTEFRWAWGQAIGPVTAVEAAADRIVHVLREVRP